jgi:intein/homing endonuclease
MSEEGIKEIEVKSYDREKEEFVDKKTVDIFKTGKKKIIELEFSDGHKVKCTPDHKFLLKDGTYKEAQYLTEYDEPMEYKSKNQLAAEKRWKNKEYRKKISEKSKIKMIGNKNAVKKTDKNLT